MGKTVENWWKCLRIVVMEKHPLKRYEKLQRWKWLNRNYYDRTEGNRRFIEENG